MTTVTGLGLESSCDETSASVVVNGSQVLSNIISSQIDIHTVYHGVVPELASRAHLESINNIIHRALDKAGKSFNEIDYVAATNKPGLVGSLLIGLQSAKAISFSLGIPLITINHLEAHLYAPTLEGHKVEYPCAGLLVSGGNTALYVVNGPDEMERVGSTSDDAAGEAFDKVAKYFELGYPGGPVIEKLAAKATIRKQFLPKILSDKHDYSFSYSGIKTAVINYMNNHPDTPPEELAYSFQERALEILVRRTRALAAERNLQTVIVAGGVAANGRLSEMMKEALPGKKILIPSPVLCTDNAAMVAGISYHYYMKKDFATLDSDVYSRV